MPSSVQEAVNPRKIGRTAQPGPDIAHRFHVGAIIHLDVYFPAIVSLICLGLSKTGTLAAATASSTWLISTHFSNRKKRDMPSLSPQK